MLAGQRDEDEPPVGQAGADFLRRLPAALAGKIAFEPPAASAEPELDGAAIDDHEPGQIVRVKDHPAKPMSVDDALYEMELVGHDFFLFHDEESDRPTVVYRRHAFDYGLIRLA